MSLSSKLSSPNNRSNRSNLPKRVRMKTNLTNRVHHKPLLKNTNAVRDHQTNYNTGEPGHRISTRVRTVPVGRAGSQPQAAQDCQQAATTAETQQQRSYY